jgi:hypothetical protein
MNERIRLFAEQSNLAELYDRYVEYCMKNADDDIMDYDTIVKKFAELIVRECVKVCRDQPNVYALKTDRDNCAIAIEEHFGVEE